MNEGVAELGETVEDLGVKITPSTVSFDAVEPVETALVAVTETRSETKNEATLAFEPEQPTSTLDLPRTDPIAKVAAPAPDIVDPITAAFRKALSDAIIRALDADLPVYLDGFGIIIPEIATGTRTRLRGDQMISRSESTRTISFEKCGELTAYHRERFERLLDTKEVIHRIQHLLSIITDDTLSEHDVRKLVRGIIRQFRSELVTHGHAVLFPELGTFYALHNRQGNSEIDWFAGADIFLSPSYERLIHEGPSTVNPRAVLDDAWELPTAAFGEPLVTHAVELATEIEKLGYEVASHEDLKKFGNGQMQVAVFFSPRSGGILTYCTNGIRSLVIDPDQNVGNELVFQLPCQAWAEPAKPTEEVPRWPVRALTLAWLLLTSSRSRSLKVGAGLACETPLLDRCDTALTGIFTTPYGLIRSEQKAAGGAFYYLNVIGITADEAKIAEKLSPNHLLALLQHRGLDQITKPNRSSVVARSFFALK